MRYFSFLPIALVAAGVGLTLTPTAAHAKTCYLQTSIGETGGHLTQRGARAAVWSNWQSRARTKYNKRFSYALAMVQNGYPKVWKENRRWKAQLRAHPCFIENGGAVIINGNTPCGFHTDAREARAQGCKTWKP